MTRAGIGVCGLVLCWGMAHAFAATAPSNPQAQPAQPHTLLPSGTITINDGAAYTNSAAVTLTLSAVGAHGTVTQMSLSNDNVTYTAPEPYASNKTWTLTSGDGQKTVYAKFGDASNLWSPPVHDGIMLDTTPPVITITSPTDGQLFGAQ